MFYEKFEFDIVIEPGNDSRFKIIPLLVKSGKESKPVESVWILLGSNSIV